MKVRFQRANHRTGNESIVLKFDDVVDGQTACILVDSGRGVDVSSLLGDGEYLAGVLLTHAHLDHFRSLGENVVDGAPVLAAAPTAAVMETVLTESRRNGRADGDVDAALDALEGVTGWRTLLGDGDVRVCAVPAGHAPGASGFVVQFRDGDVARNVLVTGDFTTTDVGGYPSIPSSLPLDVEAMVVNVGTTPDYEQRFTDAVETALARASQGFTTLATAGALAGVHLGRVCVAAVSRYGLDVDVRLVGQTAKLYADLDLPTEDVVLHREFADPASVVAPGDVTIAGPETPVDGSAQRLFDAIRDDENSALVQVTSGALDAVSSAACTTYAVEVRPHPTEQTVDELVKAFDPLHVVVAHESGADLDAYKDKYASFVWANQDAIEQTLYADGDWQAPPWVSERAERYVYGNTSEFGGNVVEDDAASLDVDLPAVSAGPVDLYREAVEVARLDDRFQTDESTAPASAGATGEATLADVLARLDDVEAALGVHDEERFSVPVTVEDDDGETVLRLPSSVAVDDADDVTVYVHTDADDTH